MTEPVVLNLTVDEAAEVHTLCDMMAKDCQHTARMMRSVPAIAALYTEGAARCARIAADIERQVPDFRELAERQVTMEELTQRTYTCRDCDGTFSSITAAVVHQRTRGHYVPGATDS